MVTKRAKRPQQVVYCKDGVGDGGLDLEERRESEDGLLDSLASMAGRFPAVRADS